MSKALYSSSYPHENIITKRTSTLLKFAGILLCIVSLIFTVKLTISMADTEVDQILMAVYGLGIEVCKWIFIPLGVAFIAHRKPFIGLSCFVTGFAVTGVSIFASLGFLTAQTKESIRQAALTSPEYVTIRNQIENKQRQIDAIQKRLEKDSDSLFVHVRGNTDDSIQTMEQLEYQQMLLLNKLKDVDVRDLSSSGALFAGLATLLNFSVEQIELIGFIVTSVLVEICGMIALGLTCFSAPRLGDKNNNTKRRQDIRTSSKRLTEGQPDTGIKDGVNGRYIKACEQVRQGILKPSYRSFKRKLIMGDETAKRYINKMLEDGIIVQKGRGYICVQ